MNDLNKGIVPDVDRLLGDCFFCGLSEEITRTNRQSGRSTVQVQERIYNFCCTEQKGNLYVSVPGKVALRNFEPLQKIKFVDVILKQTSNALNGVGYSTYAIIASDIVAAE